MRIFTKPFVCTLALMRAPIQKMADFQSTSLLVVEAFFGPWSISVSFHERRSRSVMGGLNGPLRAAETP
jgi:hypothetical protein